MNQERIMNVILAPHVTEKAANVGESSNQYVFRVASDATKPEIKKAVEALFEVEVDAVRVLNTKGKTKRFGARMGRRKDWKKAYIRLAEGSTLNIEAEA